MKDPYLIPGQVCEVWNARDQYTDTGYFWKYDRNGIPIFVESYYKGKLDVNNIFQSYKNYKPIGTEWDFSPDWAASSTCDYDGTIKFWDYDGFIRNDNDGRFYAKEWDTESTNFICPDKSRYQGDAWKTSLRMRPEWAKVNHDRT